MKIRTVSPEDFPKITKVYNDHWKDKIEAPSRYGRLSEVLVEDDNDEFIAYGLIRMWGEVMMIMDPTKSKKLRSEALLKIAESTRMTANRSGLEFVNIFTNDESFAKLLEKHFACERTDSILLRMRVR